MIHWEIGIIELSPNCDCGLTGGCNKCNPFLRDNFIGWMFDEKANLILIKFLKTDFLNIII